MESKLTLVTNPVNFVIGSHNFTFAQSGWPPLISQKNQPAWIF
jgi:hypothetical protein